MTRIYLILFILFLSCKYTESKKISLTSRIRDFHNEISSLTWYKDKLILMPQLPSTGPFSEKRLKQINKKRKAIFYSIKKRDIFSFLDGKIKSIKPKEHRIYLADSINQEFVNGNVYQGFEAIVFKEDTVFVTIESEYGGFVSKGIINSNFDIYLSNTYKKIPNQSKIDNMAEESLLLYQNRLLVIHEANSKMANPSPIVHSLTTSLKFSEAFKIKNQEWRITDASAVDKKNHFWVINYMYEKDSPSIGRQKRVERLLEFKIKDLTIVQSGKIIKIPQLNANSVNWEGIARLDNYGFLIINDEYPKELGTTLFFVTYQAYIF